MAREVKFIPAIVIDARCIPYYDNDDVQEWLDDNEVSTHYAKTLIRVPDDGNAFAEWLKSEGYEFSGNEYGDYVGILGT